MAMSENKMEPSQIHTKIGDKTFSSEEYAAWLYDAPNQLRRAYSAAVASASGKKIEDIGRDVIVDIIKDAKNIQISPNEDEIIKAGKLKLKTLVNSIKEQCHISREDTSTIIYNHNRKNRESINVAPAEKPKPPMEIRPIRQHEISAQLKAKLDRYESIDIPKIKQLFNEYDDALTTTNAEFKEKAKLFNIFMVARQECLNDIKNALGESEALANLEVTDELYKILEKVDNLGGDLVMMSEAILNKAEKKKSDEDELPDADIIDEDIAV